MSILVAGGFGVLLPHKHRRPDGWGRCREAASASDIGQGAVGDWQLRSNDSLFLSISHGLLLRGTRGGAELDIRRNLIAGAPD